MTVVVESYCYTGFTFLCVFVQIFAKNCTKMHKGDFAGYTGVCHCGSGKKFVDCCLGEFLNGTA